MVWRLVLQMNFDANSSFIATLFAASTDTFSDKCDVEKREDKSVF
ncbi:hypothetical protein I3700191H1_17690 [Megasphaera massiliensis]